MRSVPQFYTRNWEIGAAFLCSIADPSCQTTSYPSGGSLMRAIARTIVAGALSEFTHVQDGTYPTTEIAESVLTNVVSGVALVEKDQNMGSDAQRFFKRMDWGSGGKAFIRGTGEYVGVVPPSTRVDDEIFVIVGCQQLLVLRKHSGGNERYSIVGECYVEGCARGEPLLGRLPDHVGFSIIRNRSMVGESRRFRDLRSGDLFCEDPRLGSLGVELEEFRARLAKDPEAMLDVAPEVLRARIKGLKYIDLV
ncbi:hypothetical protein M406DRAFT_355265 [Cryphonectria parasitica EP155]|uniref:Uncharacterized protein n=1 Tax=Cryphonectria parasitica (strain ATCC 38755 / EP155) TaxID=660469 RepID=A0A9P4Y9C0_CRYP1|nr:uncharacterized protein M406DRAFT_355265 [Cryphonectria parasitica EP155]KAF3769359.1 hypothetical protein M406DRAFT_355265 [Cryphonectria parasitica EP155]